MMVKYDNQHKVWHFDTMFFTAKGVNFKITGDRKEDGEWYTTVMNLDKAPYSDRIKEMKTSELAELILKYQTGY